MAAMITRKAVFSSSSRLLHKLLSPPRPLAATSPISRSLYTNVDYQVRCPSDDEEEDDTITLSERGYRDDWKVDCGTLFHYLLDHPEPLRRTFLKIMENPLLLAKSQGRRDGWKRGIHIREDEDCVYLSIDMPGLGKEDVKVSVDRNCLIIRGLGEKKSEDGDESGRSYTSRIGFGFLQEPYKLDQIKGEMKNGVLRLSVPKVKEEEKKTKDVFEVKIE